MISFILDAIQAGFGFGLGLWLATLFLGVVLLLLCVITVGVVRWFVEYCR